MTDDGNDGGRGYARRDHQKVALGFGIVFVLVGIAGFLPGLTTGTLSFAGPMSGARLLGIFEVSVLHNLVHLLYGIVGIIAAVNGTLSRYYLIWGGVVYLILWVYGLDRHRRDDAGELRAAQRPGQLAALRARGDHGRDGALRRPVGADRHPGPAPLGLPLRRAVTRVTA